MSSNTKKSVLYPTDNAVDTPQDDVVDVDTVSSPPFRMDLSVTMIPL